MSTPADWRITADLAHPVRAHNDAPNVQEIALTGSAGLPRSVFKIRRDEELESRIEAAGLDLVAYSSKRRRYRIRLSDEDVIKQREIIQELVMRALNRA